MRTCTLRTVVAALFGSLLAVQAVGQLPAENEMWGPGKWMADALDNTIAKATIIAQRADAGMDRDRVCLVGGYFEVGYEARFTWTFKKGERVMIVAGGDDDVKDLDLWFRGADSTDMLDEDTLVDSTPIIIATIPRDGKYTLGMKLYDAQRSSFCAVALMVEGDRAIALDQVNDAAISFLSLGQFAKNKGLDLDFPRNEWSIFGAVMQGNETQEITGISIDKAPFHVFGASDDIEKHDIDLVLSDANGNELGSDKETDGIPTITHGSTGTGFRIKLLKANDNGTAFCVFGIVKQ